MGINRGILPGIKRITKRAGGTGFRFIMENTSVFHNECIVFMYHRVVKRMPTGLYDSGLCVTAQTFEMHMDLLTKLFTMVPLEDIAKSKPAGRVCAITFDDGWLDNFEVAYPILKKYQVPATIFLPTAMIGTKQWFWFELIWDLARKSVIAQKQDQLVSYFQTHVPAWREMRVTVAGILQLIQCLKTKTATALEQQVQDAFHLLNLHLPTDRILINWEEAAEMGNNGITFGSHGLNHRILPSLGVKEKKEEIMDSFKVLRGHDIPFARVFCYPNGDWDEDCLKILSDSGYLGAVTTRTGSIQHDTTLFLMNRLGVHEDISDTPSLFSYRLFQVYK